MRAIANLASGRRNDMQPTVKVAIAARWNSALTLAFGVRPIANCPSLELLMHSIIYLVGLIVVVLFILSALGLR
jgi:hypothetical protein